MVIAAVISWSGADRSSVAGQTARWQVDNLAGLADKLGGGGARPRHYWQVQNGYTDSREHDLVDLVSPSPPVPLLPPVPSPPRHEAIDSPYQLEMQALYRSSKCKHSTDSASKCTPPQDWVLMGAGAPPSYCPRHRMSCWPPPARVVGAIRWSARCGSACTAR